MPQPKVNVAGSDGSLVGVTGNALDVHLKTGDSTIDIGDVSLLLGGTAASTNNGTADATTLRVTIASNTTGVLSVDDNGSTLSIDDGGGTITVDGTVTAGHDITGMVSDRDLDVGTTAEKIHTASDVAIKRIDIQAAPANTGYIFVGDSGVAGDGTGGGIRLEAGDFYSLDIDNTGDVYVAASVADEDVYYTYYT